MPTKKTIMIFSVSLILLAGLAWLVGWSLHALVAGNRSFTPTPSITPTVISSPGVPPNPTVSEPAASPEQTMQVTSTPNPTYTPTLTPKIMTVLPGEGLYNVCRRYCPDQFSDTEIGDVLEDYAHRVAEHNNLFWIGKKGPHLRRGQKIQMLPCP